MIMNKILTVIPARGGSKGLPGKNIRPLYGKPLIGYSIDAAREVLEDKDICVSTDSPEIAKVVEEYGLQIPFLRPEYLATDTATTADVLLHAIMDALLGAAALGDIGKHFPDTDQAYEGISSIKLLEEVGQLLEKENYVIDNIDATIIAQKPKMRPHIEKMEENIAQALKIDVSQVNVKATTEEGLGFTGSEDGISSQAICAISSIYENSIAVGGSERNCAGCPGCGK